MACMVAVGNTDRLKFRVSFWGVLLSPSLLWEEGLHTPVLRREGPRVKDMNVLTLASV